MVYSDYFTELFWDRDWSELALEAREWEATRFPQYFAKTNQYLTERPNNVFYYSPSHHIQGKLINEKIIEDLVSDSDKKLLSLGSGMAFLEQFLVEVKGININQIVLVDSYNADLPAQFKSYNFDFESNWPHIGERFSYVIFPESSNVGIDYEHDAIIHGLYFGRAQKVLSKGGMVRITFFGPLKDSMTSIMRKIILDSPDASEKFEIYKEGSTLVYEMD